MRYVINRESIIKGQADVTLGIAIVQYVGVWKWSRIEQDCQFGVYPYWTCHVIWPSFNGMLFIAHIISYTHMCNAWTAHPPEALLRTEKNIWNWAGILEKSWAGRNYQMVVFSMPHGDRILSTHANNVRVIHNVFMIRFFHISMKERLFSGRNLINKDQANLSRMALCCHNVYQMK